MSDLSRLKYKNLCMDLQPLERIKISKNNFNFLSDKHTICVMISFILRICINTVNTDKNYITTCCTGSDDFIQLNCLINLSHSKILRYKPPMQE